MHTLTRLTRSAPGVPSFNQQQHITVLPQPQGDSRVLGTMHFAAKYTFISDVCFIRKGFFGVRRNHKILEAHVI